MANIPEERRAAELCSLLLSTAKHGMRILQAQKHLACVPSLLHGSAMLGSRWCTTAVKYQRLSYAHCFLGLQKNGMLRFVLAHQRQMPCCACTPAWEHSGNAFRELELCACSSCENWLSTVVHCVWTVPARDQHSGRKTGIGAMLTVFEHCKAWHEVCSLLVGALQLSIISG